MSENMQNILAGIIASPQRTDLLAGFVALCRTDKSESRQADSLVSCARVLLPAQPLLALKLLQLALALAPQHLQALLLAREIFKRRGRLASEQRVTELLNTQHSASAVTHLPENVKASVIQTVSADEKTAERSPPEAIHEHQEPPLLLVEQPVDETLSENAVEQKSEPEIEVQPQSNAHELTAKADEHDRVMEYLKRCGFDPAWVSLAAGFSKNNAGLISFAGMLVGLNMIQAAERPLAGIMLLKMINEKPDESGAKEILERVFPELVTIQREGK